MLTDVKKKTHDTFTINGKEQFLVRERALWKEVDINPHSEWDRQQRAAAG